MKHDDHVKSQAANFRDPGFRQQRRPRSLAAWAHGGWHILLE